MIDPAVLHIVLMALTGWLDDSQGIEMTSGLRRRPQPGGLLNFYAPAA